MHRIETFGLGACQTRHAHGADMKPGLFDALDNLSGDMPLCGIGLDDR